MEEEENKKEGEAQKSEMVEEMQRAHHKSVSDGTEERPKMMKEGIKGEGRPKARQVLGSLESGSFSF